MKQTSWGNTNFTSSLPLFHIISFSTFHLCSYNKVNNSSIYLIYENFWGWEMKQPPDSVLNYFELFFWGWKMKQPVIPFWTVLGMRIETTLESAQTVIHGSGGHEWAGGERARDFPLTFFYVLSVWSYLLSPKLLSTWGARVGRGGRTKDFPLTFFYLLYVWSYLLSPKLLSTGGAQMGGGQKVGHGRGGQQGKGPGEGGDGRGTSQWPKVMGTHINAYPGSERNGYTLIS
jgi:hypothetical protein